MIDLQKFCSTDERRESINRPFSRGDYSYATDGRLLIRVRRDNAILENKKSPNVEKIFSSFDENAEFTPIGNIEIPKSQQRQTVCPCAKHCSFCDRGGDADEDCELCKGDGVIQEVNFGVVKIENAYFNAKFIKNIINLPNLEFTKNPMTIM